MSEPFQSAVEARPLPGTRLPVGCEVSYLPGFVTPQGCAELWEEITRINEFGRTEIGGGPPGHWLDSRKCQFMDESLVGDDRMSHTGTRRYPWSPRMRSLKSAVEDCLGYEFQVCVCIFYLDGNEGVDFHSDYPAFGDTTVLASISLGEERRFALRPTANPEEVFELTLEAGSLLVMGRGCQQHYEHALPKSPSSRNSRINLTFRPYGRLKAL